MHEVIVLFPGEFAGTQDPRRLVVAHQTERFEFDLSMGESLCIGDVLLTVLESENQEVRLLMERIPSDEDIDIEEPLAHVRAES